MTLPANFFDRDVLAIARELIGVILLVDGVGGMIVETEAYAPHEPASHSFRGPTARNAAMFGPPGHAYVYKIYGIHWCLNFVCRPGHAVLIRALEPIMGQASMVKRRGITKTGLLCSGPGRLAQALGIDQRHNSLPLHGPPFALLPAAGAHTVVAATRIGITKAADLPWRFCARDSRYLSKAVPVPPISG